MPLTWERLLELQAENYAEDLPLSPSMLQWDEAAARRHFEHPTDVAFAMDDLSCQLSAAAEGPSEDDQLLIARRIWDGLSDVCMEAADGSLCVVLRRGRIGFAGHLSDLPPQFECVARVDYGECTIMPGLIDAHVHLESDPCFPLHGQPPLADAALLQAMQERAADMVAHGITSCRDLGGKGASLALRALTRRGGRALPRLLVAGQPITRHGGHCHQWGGGASGEAEVRAVIARQAERGCDLIKVMATGGVRTAGTNPADAAFTLREMRAAVEAAAARGLKVAAHAHGVGGIRACVDARVHSIEHCSWVDRDGRWGAMEAECAREIARAGIFVSPTVPASWGQARFAGLREAMSPTYQFMVAAGVRFVASSDSGAIPNVGHHQLLDGLLVFQKCARLSNAALLRCATSEAAAACTLEDETGRVAEGLAADLLVVPGNPLEDVEASLRNLVAVICRGRFVEPCAGAMPPKARRSFPPSWTRAAVQEAEPCACTRRMHRAASASARVQ
ncbi:hypothetical protein AB1Y20_015408 [Prymnesium parvum]|uniref:Amidohydrolase-related domain-containing protein n=1 Tax=Prymnesium parvum TaxID=97485 RepID=A0AB34K0D2_PRYPA